MSSEQGKQAGGGDGRGRGQRRSLALGLQRVVGVRVLLSDDGAVSEVIGVLRRRPVVQRVSTATAAELVARGAPLAVRRATSAAPPSAPQADADAVAEGR